MFEHSNNYVYLRGNLCRDPKIYNLPSGKNIMKSSLAVHLEDGVTVFYDVTFRRVTSHIHKGDFMLVAGRLRAYKIKEREFAYIDSCNFRRLYSPSDR